MKPMNLTESDWCVVYDALDCYAERLYETAFEADDPDAHEGMQEQVKDLIALVKSHLGQV